MRSLLPWAIVLACGLVGAGVGLAVGELRDEGEQAEVTLAVGQGTALFPSRPTARASEPVTQTLADLVESQLVAENVVGNLRLTHVDADELLERLAVDVRDGSNVVVLRIGDEDPQRAVRIAQEIALVFGALVRERFTTTGTDDQLPLTASVFDPAHLEQAEPRRAEYAAIGGGAGIVVGSLLALLALGRRPRIAEPGEAGDRLDRLTSTVDAQARELDGLREELTAARELANERQREVESERRTLAALRAAPASSSDPEREASLARRSEVITKRELEVARRHAELARRERELDEREQEREREAVAAAAMPAPAPAPPPPVTAAGDGELSRLATLDELDHLVSAHSADYPDRADEWSYYLLYLRGYGDAQGRLPASFDWLIEETFGDLLARR